MGFFITVLSIATCCYSYLSASILEEARGNLRKIEMECPSSLKPSIRWERNLNSIKGFINQCTNESDAIRFAQIPDYSGFDHRVAIDPNSAWVQRNYQALLDTHPLFSDAILELEDSPANCPDLSGIYQGKIITNTLFFSANYIFECLKHIQPNVVCEIGGGYGGPAYVWLTNRAYNPGVYIDIDYPECLFFAEIYLKSSLPQADFIYIDSPEKAQSIQSNLKKEKQTVILCPIQFADYIKNTSIDLITNVGSLQEMEESAVDFWMNWVEKSKSACFFSCNYFCQPIGNLSQSTNLYAPRLPKNWTCINKLDYEMPLFILHTDHEFAVTFAKREIINDSVKNMRELYYWDEIRSKNTWSRKDFQESMDIIRTTQSIKIALDVLFRVINMRGVTYVDSKTSLSYPASNTPYIPKESLYIAKWLWENRDSLSESEIDALKRVKNKLSMIYESSSKGTQ